jgi:hypothetical protein
MINKGHFMKIANLILEYLEVLVWPIVSVVLVLTFRKPIESLIPRSKIKFSISNVTIETSLENLENSVKESLRGRSLTNDQWEWLRKLRDKGRIPFNGNYYEQLRPLRNAGLIREYPEGWLSNSEEIEITTLGNLLLEAFESQEI